MDLHRRILLLMPQNGHIPQTVKIFQTGFCASLELDISLLSVWVSSSMETGCFVIFGEKRTAEMSLRSFYILPRKGQGKIA